MITSVLLDTNIIIYREDNKIVDKELQQLLKVLNDPDYRLLVHPLSIKEIKNVLNYFNVELPDLPYTIKIYNCQ
ncbi:MAG: hypothetical protein LBD03_10025 [Methanobrevibacter sp.]|jgi:predicted nucleic acid-binding protein|nr:hypothetical protein [Candidatus Methanovirga procula]